MTYTIDIAAIENEFGNTGHIVGFANKFYTLWRYEITHNEANGELVFDAYFIKNIGSNNPYEGAYPFDAGLKGVKVHITSGREGTGFNLTPQEFRALRFSKGKYKGLLIADSIDLAGLVWMYNTRFVASNICPARQKAELANIANRAIELGAVNIEDRLWRPEDVDTDRFSRNPRFDEKISTCNDVNILCWKWNKKVVSEFRPQFVTDGELANIKARALELGSIELEGWLYSPDKQEEDWFKEKMATRVAVENGEAIVCTPAYNITVDGFLKINGNLFYFEHQYYYGTYYGPEHSFPLDNKGKAKQVRNKKISINSYEKVVEENGNSYYKVLDWNFVK